MVVVEDEALKEAVEKMFPALENTKITVKEQVIKVHPSGNVAWFSEVWDWDLVVEAKELEVAFNTGGIYRYQGVPRKVYKELLAAESKGRYMRAYIIDVYPYYQVFRRR